MGDSDADWSVPGVERAEEPPSLTDDVVALSRAVSAALEVDPALLDGPQALARTRVLLVDGERLHAAQLRAVADVHARQLFTHDAAGSTASWLDQQVAGQRRHVQEAARLAACPRVEAALAAGWLSARSADVLCKALARVPEQVEEEQLLGVLQNGVPALLADRPVPPEDLSEAIGGGVAATASRPAARLEAAFVLLAQHLPPSCLPQDLGVLVDALLPERLDDEARESYEDASLQLRRHDRGWRLRAELDLVTGQQLHDALHARRPNREAASTMAAAQAGAEGAGGAASDGAGSGVAATTVGDADADADATADADAAAEGDLTLLPLPVDAEAFGAVGPGPAPEHWTSPNVEGTPRLSRQQADVVALRALLSDLGGVAPGSGSPLPVALTVVTTVATLEGEAGALPGWLQTTRGPASLSLAQIRRLGCASALAAVLVDAAGTPIGASGEHRHATARERRALAARWGGRCAVNGCTSAGAIPHHVDPWWKVHRTRLQDLVPICEHHHHDVHDGHRTLRLRDGQLIDEQGWVGQTVVAA